MTTVTDYTALLTGSTWNGIEVTDSPVFVTYSFDATAPASDQDHISASAWATFTPFTAAQQAQAQAALQEWSDASGVVFLQVAPGQGDINFASYDFSSDPGAQFSGGQAYYPWGNWNYSTFPHFAAPWPGAGNILMNTAFETGGEFAYVTLLHEVGHALGLKHPYEEWTQYGTFPATEHNTWDPSAPAPETVMNEGANALAHLAALDIAAIQAIYGTAAAQGTQDISWSWNAATQTLTQHVSNADTIAVRGVATNNVIYAGSGTDVISAIGAGSNTLYAGAGASTLIGGSGSNVMFAGAGAGTFIGTFGATTVEYGNVQQAVTVDLLHPWLNGGAAADDALIDVHNVWGGKFGDALAGDDAGDVLKGLNGADTIAGGAGNDTINGGNGQDSMAGGAGDDTYYVNSPNDTVVELADGGVDTVYAAVNFTLVAGNAVEFLRANSDAGLRLAGNELAGTIRGAAGNDTLLGGGGADALAGGGGADTFRLNALEESTPAAAGRDRIMDFSSAEHDVIDLRAIDAQARVPQNQAFTFIGTDPFSGTRGELRYAPFGASTLVSGDVNGDGTADFAILCSGSIAFAASDFLL